MSTQTTEHTRTCRKCKLTFVPSFTFDFYADGGDSEIGLCETCMMREMFASKELKEPVLVPADIVERLCKLHHGAKTCSFLITDGKLLCAKGTAFEQAIRERREEGTMAAKSDNCSGPPDYKASKKKKH